MKTKRPSDQIRHQFNWTTLAVTYRRAERGRSGKGIRVKIGFEMPSLNPTSNGRLPFQQFPISPLTVINIPDRSGAPNSDPTQSILENPSIQYEMRIEKKWKAPYTNLTLGQSVFNQTVKKTIHPSSSQLLLTFQLNKCEKGARLWRSKKCDGNLNT